MNNLKQTRRRKERNSARITLDFQFLLWALKYV